MLKIQKISAIALLVAAVFATAACNEKEKAPATDSKAVAQADSNLAKDPSYAVGILLGSDLKGLVDSQKEVMSYDQEKLLSGVKDALSGKVDLSQNQELQKTLTDLNEKLSKAAEAKAKEDAQKAAEAAKTAKADGEKFAAEFKAKEGVKQTKSGLLYRIEKEGEGAPIKATDIVKVHYTGKLPNGTVFDSSVERGQPAEFALNQVIPGWTEGLQLVKKGGKIELVIPASLAYGDQDLGAIPANSTLHFDVEVLDVKPAK
ncbi:FKBP-type peptidyl-prolyl cis-trans isomerase FkpA [Pasteurella langaaensis DSM 22999]|uniref:Peptidyl-prolyl cis-trans isomerase n=1 Tax=Alitibacter langaaensis DSM 22999 TaxID=1122935 RepID=A0A2U0TGE7_9PAST|nr:FKBP-type peptidyl-prolyl cis-trans isomerase [Pasteurella langaaensis]PVX42689.1 FKBP-type peptidyl-prolyl cis-trans isomerase FkpA [Pasteurella langaaensis DSM 22999]